MKRILLLLIVFAAFYEADATDLKLPMDLHSTAVLPQGVRNLRFRGMVVNGNEKYNEVGSVVPLADPFYKNITWNDLIDPKTDAENKNLLSGYLDSKKINKNDVVGKTTGDVHVEAKPIVPILAFGITDRLTAALAIPVIRYQTRSLTGFVYDENLKRVYDELEKDQKISELNELSRKMVNPIATKLQDFGYIPLNDEKGTILGDVSVTTKYMAYKGDDLKFTTQVSVSTPTGKSKNEDNVVSIGSDRVWALGGALITDYTLASWVGLSGAGGYTYKVPGKVEKRVPYRQDSKVTPDKDQNVDRKMGDEFFGQAGVKFLPGDGFTLSFGYTFQYKSADKYKGSKYESERYEWMGQNTVQRLQTLTGGLKLDTISLFRKKEFAAPMELALNHSVTLSGKNASRDSLTTLDFSLFF